ncbi:MAG: hypothetical protein ACLT8E_01290 [Akkermansia sp.]
MIASEDYEYDNEQRLVKTTGQRAHQHDGMDVLWAVEETDEDGITTGYGYNSAKSGW